jgi:hypothetical protein
MSRSRLSSSIAALSAALFLCAATTQFIVVARGRDGHSSHMSGGELLRKAGQLTNIRSGDAPSFRLTAQVEAYDEKGKKKEGTYTLLWDAPTIWREEIAFPDSSQVRLARINKLLISRKPPIPSEETYRVARLMDIPAFLRLGVRDQVQGLHEKTKDGLSEERVDITIGGRPWKKVYFDGAVPVPIRIEYKGAALGAQYPYKEFDLKFLFGDFMEFHGLEFPQTLRQFESNVLRDEVQVKEWTERTFGESDFFSPDDSRWIRWCPNVAPPRIESPTPTQVSNPSFPPQFRAGGPPSRVVINGIIGTDGQWHNVEAVKSEGSIVDSFWIGLMHRQRFTPARCGETPVEYEMMIEFDYP